MHVIGEDNPLETHKMCKVQCLYKPTNLMTTRLDDFIRRNDSTFQGCNIKVSHLRRLKFLEMS